MSDLSPSPLLVDVKQLAQMLNVSPATLWRMRAAGQLPQPVHLGRLARWRMADIQKWLDSGCPLCGNGPRRK
ncbi:MAG TPA: helix-turn-helix domain-containing protein [Gemmataceae bacterium]|nr:helix-turn-helix domain-containing protein [Gemmataceae bacterium]